MKILTVCPSINPEKFQSMQESFYLTSSEGNVLYEVCTGTVTEAFNLAFKKYPNFDFYHMTNDDVEYITPQWDVKLATKGKISWGKDGIQNENLCTFPMIDGDIVRALGWLQMPNLERYAGDVVWKFIGQECKILNYVPEVIIRHYWEGCSDEDMNVRDMNKFAEWLVQSYKDVNKIKEMLDVTKN